MRNRLPADPFVIKWREPEVGFWMLYSRRGGVLVPSGIFWCSVEPGNEENKLDRQFLAARIGEKWVEIYDVWWRVLLCEVRPNHWRCAHPLIPKDGLTKEQEFRYLTSEMAWLKENDRMHPLAKPYTPVALTRLPLPF